MTQEHRENLVNERIDRLERLNRAMGHQIAENGQLLRALEERITIDGAAIVAKMSADGELKFLGAVKEPAKKDGL